LFVETDSLTKRYRQVAALLDCSLGVQRGEIFGLLGPNGAGKTTLLRLMLGFLKPTSGTAHIDTLDCTRQSLEVRHRVSYLPGEPRHFSRMRAKDVLWFYSHVRPSGDQQRARRIAERLGLDLSRSVTAMSTGMRQKLALAAVLSPDVPLIILDEPTSSLDPTVRSLVAELVGELRAEGRTVLFSSHVLSEVEEVCDRVAILRAGRLVHMQKISELKQQHLIHAQLNGQSLSVPPELQQSVSVRTGAGRQVTIQSSGELAPLLGWLAELRLSQVRVEPVGLAAVYQRYHAQGSE